MSKMGLRLLIDEIRERSPRRTKQHFLFYMNGFVLLVIHAFVLFLQCAKGKLELLTTDAELLVVFEDDFNVVLRPVMAKQWLEKKLTIKTLDYFSFFNDEQVISACKLGMLRQFEPLESIYYEDKGQVSYVYFVISGECMILQCLKMKVTEVQGKKSFELVDISKDDSAGMFQDTSTKKFMQKLTEDNVSQLRDTYDIDQEIASIESRQDDKTTLMPQKMDIKSIEIACGHRRASGSFIAGEELESSDLDEILEEEEGEEEEQASTGEIVELKRTFASVTEELIKQFNKADDDKKSKPGVAMAASENNKNPEENNNDDNQQGEANAYGEDKQITEEHANKAHADVTGRTKQAVTVTLEEDHQKDHKTKHKPSLIPVEDRHKAEGDAHKLKETHRDVKNVGSEYDADTDNTEYTEYTEYEEEHSSQTRDYESMSTGRSFQKPETKKFRGKVENHFIDVGSLTYGGIFGLGEKIEHRVIMARTTVQCLLLPRFWLFERDQNPGNIWQRRRFYLDSTIPSRQTLFKDFLATRKWQQFKKDLIQSNLDPISTNNSTKVQDIPIICRIVESHAD